MNLGITCSAGTYELEVYIKEMGKNKNSGQKSIDFLSLLL